jgi:RHS repeat-associated protein
MRPPVAWACVAPSWWLRQVIFDGSSSGWVVTEDLKLLSDPVLYGRHVADLRASDNALVRSYVWGLDLSGTMDGAGGVGGLLWVTLHTASGPAAGTHFVAYDGNGNIVALSGASDGSETARYEYGPFGEPIRVTGSAAAQNPFWFSTKRTDNTTDLVLYEYRAYSPTLGRWLSRDPLGELGGLSLYGFSLNDPVDYVDKLGMTCLSCNAAPAQVPDADAGGAATAHECKKGTLTFTTASPDLIGSEPKIKRLCGGAAACSGPNRKPKITCKKCSACTWKMVVEAKVKCLIYLADPKKINVQYFPNGLASAIKHEQCHCEDWKSAFQKLIEEAAAKEYRSKAECEQAKKAFDAGKRLDELMADSKNHMLPKYQPGGECYAYASWPDQH